jgi:hypothetical protein
MVRGVIGLIKLGLVRKKKIFSWNPLNDESSELFVKSQEKRILGMKTQKIRLGFAGVC